MKPVFITCKGFGTDAHLAIVRVDRIQVVQWDAARSATRIDFIDTPPRESAYVNDTPAQVRRLIDEALKEPSA